MSNVLEGIGVPLLKVGETVHKLPAPFGTDREGIRSHDFQDVTQGAYWSEGGKYTEIGKKYQYQGSLQWARADKVLLRILQKAATKSSCEYTLNEDKPGIKFNVIIKNLKFKPLVGLYGWYTISVQLYGSDLLDEPGYGDLEVAGFGMDYGNTVDGQTP